MKKIGKIITLVLSLALIMGALAVLSAANTTPELGAANVVYGDQLSLVFTVNNIAEGETAGIAVYESADADDKAYIYADFVSAHDDEANVDYYETFPIAAKDMGKTYYVAAVSKDADGNLTVGEKTAYSIITYLDARLGDANVTAEQTALYNAIKNYGAAAAVVLKAR